MIIQAKEWLCGAKKNIPGYQMLSDESLRSG